MSVRNLSSGETISRSDAIKALRNRGWTLHEIAVLFNITRQHVSQIIHQDKAKARAVVNAAIKAGAIKRPELCESCKSQAKTSAHHSDYSKPLDVKWLCRPCHIELHHPSDQSSKRNRQMKAWRAKNPERQLAYKLKWNRKSGYPVPVINTQEAA